MPAVGTLDSVDGEESDGVYRTPIDIVAGSGQGSYGSVRQGFCCAGGLSLGMWGITPTVFGTRWDSIPERDDCITPSFPR